MRKLLKAAETDAIKTKLALRAKQAALKEITIVAIEGGKTVPPGTPKERKVTYYGKWEPTLEVERPFAYLVPATFAKAIENLGRHGVALEELTADADLMVEKYRVDKITTAAQEFQKHKLVRLEVTPGQAKHNVKAGTVVVRCTTAGDAGRVFAGAAVGRWIGDVEFL